MMSGRGRACGKVILYGEHFVLHGGTAIAVPLRTAGLTVTVESGPVGLRRVLSPLLGSERGAELMELALEGLEVEVDEGLEARVEGSLPPSMGLGSSAALCVALARALLDHLGEDSDEDRVSMAAFEMEHLFHGTPSGIDTTTITFETPCYIKGSSDWACEDAPEVDGPVAGFVEIPPGLPLMVACSGEPGNTREAIARVAKLREDHPGTDTLERLTQVADNLALRGASALRDGAWDAAGELMNENHYLLSALGLSSEHLEELRRTAVLVGAWGAKLTGAGLGGSLAVLAAPELHEALERELRIAGATAVFRA